MLRGIQVSIPGSMPLVGGLFGNDIYHPTHGAVSVTGRRRATYNFDAFNHFRRDPVGVTPCITFTTPAKTY